MLFLLLLGAHGSGHSADTRHRSMVISRVTQGTGHWFSVCNILSGVYVHVYDNDGWRS